MPYPLNNVVTTDNYDDPCSFDTPPVSAAFVQVYNAAVYYTVTTANIGVKGGAYPERYLTPGKGSFEEGTDWRTGEKLIRLQFRSAATGVPARVSVA